MSYRVVNTLTDEVMAELGNEDLAVSMAEGFAKDSDFTEQFAVYESVLRYETAPIRSKRAQETES
jgi:hypothetical protein